jgi:hypothetical protein
MIVVPTPRWIWAAIAVMVLCMIGYIIVGISASQAFDCDRAGHNASVVRLWYSSLATAFVARRRIDSASGLHWAASPWLFCHRYSSATCPNRRRTCLLLNLPISKSVVRLNATEPAWPNTFQSPCARSIAAAGLGQSIGSPAVTPPSTKSKGKATKEVISVIGYNCLSTPQAPRIAV